MLFIGTFSESDVELFEDNPFQYIRADIEGSDAETRRRSASDFVRALCKVKEQSVSAIFSAYLGNLIGVSYYVAGHCGYFTFIFVSPGVVLLVEYSEYSE